MEEELAALKVELRSLVVSSPTPVCANKLQNDYREMIGRRLPFQKFGYKDVLSFLKERLSDCFVLDGNPRNPTLVPIVPESLKHIDQMISKQKLSAKDKFKGKRRSILDTPSSAPTNGTNRYVPPTFRQNRVQPTQPNPLAVKHLTPEPRPIRPKLDDRQANVVQTNVEPRPIIGQSNFIQHNLTSYTSISPNSLFDAHRKSEPLNNNKDILRMRHPFASYKGIPLSPTGGRPVRASINGTSEQVFAPREISPQRITMNRPRMHNPTFMESTTSIETKSDTSYETTSSKVRALDDMKPRLRTLIEENPDGIWCVELMTMYKKRFDKELSYSAAGCSSVIALVRRLTDVFSVERPDPAGDWRLYDAARPPPPPRLKPHPLKPRLNSTQTIRFPDEDALPGVPYEPGVFPEDCMQCDESIPRISLAAEEIIAEDSLEVQPGDVYSPSHFWLMRLGDNYHSKLYKMMDEMNVYYKGEGGKRYLSIGAVRVGQYVCACYSSDWHRAVIVNVLDSDNVKLRYIDFGTVEQVPVFSLKPLLHLYARLPAQAIRARLAGVKPPAGGKAWPHTSCSAFLSAIYNKQLIAEVVSVDTDEDILEVYLVDTSTDEDICINEQLIVDGYADRHFESYLHVSVPPRECSSVYSDEMASASVIRAGGPIPTWDSDVSEPSPPSPPPLERQRALFQQLPDVKVFDRIVKIVSLDKDNILDTSMNSSNSISSGSTVKFAKTKALRVTIDNTITKQSPFTESNNEHNVNINEHNELTLTSNNREINEPIETDHKTEPPKQSTLTPNIEKSDRITSPDNNKKTNAPDRIQNLLERRQKMLSKSSESAKTDEAKVKLDPTDRIAKLLSLRDKK